MKKRSLAEETVLLLDAIDAGLLTLVTGETTARVVRGLKEQNEFLVGEVQKNGPLGLDFMAAQARIEELEASSVDSECACSLGDFVGIQGRAETVRCLECGKRPPGADTVLVQWVQRGFQHVPRGGRR
jgi:hypothetical protein